MIIVHDIFICKPGQASKLAKLFKEVMGEEKNIKTIMTDMVGDFNKVVMVSEYESLTAYEKSWEDYMKDTKKMKEMEEKMSDYHNMFMTGKREIFRVW